mmetsp:Transcript_1466/g.2221  ORF Transcript_1466/g.2221 Transcript_1466/m.2221 type:complete len:226 (+) Transcript_1466:48-725(+)
MLYISIINMEATNESDDQSYLRAAEAIVQDFLSSVGGNIGTSNAKLSTIKSKLSESSYILLDNPKSKKEKAKRKANNHMGKIMSSSEKRRLKMLEIPENCRKYSMYVPLHELWLQYMKRLIDKSQLGTVAGDGMILTADWHGAIITVVQSRCPSYIGAEGILILETENMFNLITPNDTLFRIPKAHNVFCLFIGHLQVHIYGNQVCFRSSERSVRRFKPKFSSVL